MALAHQSNLAFSLNPDFSISSDDSWLQRLFDPRVLSQWFQENLTSERTPSLLQGRCFTKISELRSFSDGHVGLCAMCLPSDAGGWDVALMFSHQPRLVAESFTDLHSISRTFIHDANNKLATVHGAAELLSLSEGEIIDMDTVDRLRSASRGLSKLIEDFRARNLMNIRVGTLIQAAMLLWPGQPHRVLTAIPSDNCTAEMKGRLADWLGFFKDIDDSLEERDRVVLVGCTSEETPSSLAILSENPFPDDIAERVSSKLEWLGISLSVEGCTIKIFRKPSS